jgi:probable HAF family extracellular repeat protein
MSMSDKSLRAFVLGQGQMYDVGLLSPLEQDDAFSIATDINSDGRIVGYSNNSEGRLHAYHWDHENGMVDLGSLSTGRSYAYSINDAGRVVGWSQVEGMSGYRAFKWKEETGIAELEGNPGLPSVAYAINNAGNICGASGTLWNVLRAALWTTDDVIDLGTIADMSFSSGQDLNDIGHVVGWSYPAARCKVRSGQAVIWDRQNGMQDLNTLISPDSGWQLHKAMGVNNDGRIVGCGTFEGRQQSFLLTPEDYATDVTRHLHLHQMSLKTNQKTGIMYQMVMIKNISDKVVKGPLQLVLRNLPTGVSLLGKMGEFDTNPFCSVNTDHLSPGGQMSTVIQFVNADGKPIDYDLACYAGTF